MSVPTAEGTPSRTALSDPDRSRVRADPRLGGYLVAGFGALLTAVLIGVPVLAAHLFIFYFGCISNVTPPVSLAAYAAADSHCQARSRRARSRSQGRGQGVA